MEVFSTPSNIRIGRITEICGHFGIRKIEDARNKERSNPGDTQAKIVRARGLSIEEKDDTLAFLLKVYPTEELGIRSWRICYGAGAIGFT